MLTVALNTCIGCLLVLTGWRATTDARLSNEKAGSGVKAALQGIGIGVPILTVGLAVILLLTLNQQIFLKSTIYKTQRPGR